jgi:hypothetical protein
MGVNTIGFTVPSSEDPDGLKVGVGRDADNRTIIALNVAGARAMEDILTDVAEMYGDQKSDKATVASLLLGLLVRDPRPAPSRTQITEVGG